ncbi:Uncharacterised protein [Acholeplasma oculi]|uniref:Uncharacterized protein n=1 Tax=Acholeplasma oculi TaxID=35623 RepID=A0A061AAW7_9MOLU|nr:hypothetical protein [Acholeplasma oculi]CDR31040.1 hypothetical protein Aocu_09670 [Acholeplasma oculi]SKC36608.1 hypothetical protein SAMN02745122_0395 [Acholeplasma oculi]SUT90583.1 Uncharacterised protein [Acholeplasma oculi]
MGLFKVKKKKHIGDVYAIPPEHIVEASRIKEYRKIKTSRGQNPDAKKLVMVGVEKSSNKVQLSDVSTKATQRELSKKQAVKLDNSKFKKASYADTSTKSKSEKTRKHFKVGVDPLTKVNRSSIKIHSNDMNKYENARSIRFPGTKNKKPK